MLRHVDHDRKHRRLWVDDYVAPPDRMTPWEAENMFEEWLETHVPGASVLSVFVAEGGWAAEYEEQP